MSVLADILATVHLNLETGEFEASAAKTADSAGTTMSQRISSKLKTGLALGLAAGFGLATKQLVELDNATAKFTADTGATEDQAKAAGKAINDMAGKNLQPIAKIGDVLAMVTTNMGLQGDEAAALTQKILTYATATGQDAAEATGVLDDLMDRYGLSAAEVSDVMDRLVANTQKYGGTVKDQQQALADLAPVLAATNASWQDGVALLGFFETAGVKSTAAAAGLNRAVKLLKPGQDIQALFDQISTIEDPAKRTAEAVRLFGKGAGPDLALALGKGKVELKDFGLTAEETAGATDKAGAVISGTLQNQITLALKQLGSTAADVLGSAGPLATGLASIVSLGSPVLAATLMMATGTTTLSAAMAALWVTLGPVTVALLAIAGIIVTVAAVSELLKDKTSEADKTYVAGIERRMEITRLATDELDEGTRRLALYQAAWGLAANEMLDAGHTAEEARDALRKAGWTDADIAELEAKSAAARDALMIPWTDKAVADLKAVVDNVAQIRAEAAAQAVADAAQSVKNMRGEGARYSAAMRQQGAAVATATREWGGSVLAATNARRAETVAAAAAWRTSFVGQLLGFAADVHDGANKLQKAIDEIGKPHSTASRLKELEKVIANGKKKLLAAIAKGDFTDALQLAQVVTDAQTQVDELNTVTATGVDGVVAVFDAAGQKVPADLKDMWTDANGVTHKGAAKHLATVKASASAVEHRTELLKTNVTADMTTAANAGPAAFKAAVSGGGLAASALAGSLASPFDSSWQSGLRTSGEHGSQHVIDGWNSNYQDAINASNNIARALGSRVNFSDPPPGPLNKVREWMGHMFDHLVGGGREHFGKLDTFSMEMGRRLVPASLSLGDLSGSVGPIQHQLALSGGSASTTNNIVNVAGLIKAETPEDIGRTLRRVAALGLG